MNAPSQSAAALTAGIALEAAAAYNEYCLLYLGDLQSFHRSLDTCSQFFLGLLMPQNYDSQKSGRMH